MKRPLLEVCVSSVEAGFLAAENGADRLEVCSALAVGGVTPHPLVFEHLRPTGLPLAVLIRPRPGHFLYDPREKDLIVEQARDFLDRRADFVVVGFVGPSGRIDLDLLDRLLKFAPPEKLVFHRAFDHARDWSAALGALMDRSVRRVLTSGGTSSALDGIPRLAELVQMAADRIEILPGGGIRSNNARAVIIGTGASQAHSSCLPAKSMGQGGAMGSSERVDVNEVKALRRVLDTLSTG